jgi:hypothetical protein
LPSEATLADPEHTAIVKKGASALQDWQRCVCNNSRPRPQAEKLLTEAGLVEGVLLDESLADQTVIQAAWQMLFPLDLREATSLTQTKMWRTNLAGADLSGADQSPSKKRVMADAFCPGLLSRAN